MSKRTFHSKKPAITPMFVSGKLRAAMVKEALRQNAGPDGARVVKWLNELPRDQQIEVLAMLDRRPQARQRARSGRGYPSIGDRKVASTRPAPMPRIDVRTVR